MHGRLAQFGALKLAAERAGIDAADDDGHSTARRRRDTETASPAAAHPMACSVCDRSSRFDALLWRRNGNDAPALAEADDFPP